jgi:hypothetical protein
MQPKAAKSLRNQSNQIKSNPIERLGQSAMEKYLHLVFGFTEGLAPLEPVGPVSSQVFCGTYIPRVQVSITDLDLATSDLAQCGRILCCTFGS